MTIRKLHSNNVTENRSDIATQYTELFFDDTTNSILLPDPTGLLETKIGGSNTGGQLPGFKSARVDDGVEVVLDTIAVRLNTGSPRSLQFRLTTGTMSVHISGVIYWSNGGNANWGAGHWQNKTLTTNWQQPFGWDFPWANDNAVYNLQDMTNGRFYRITLSIGNGYKGNFIVMERLV